MLTKNMKKWKMKHCWDILKGAQKWKSWKQKQGTTSAEDSTMDARPIGQHQAKAQERANKRQRKDKGRAIELEEQELQLTQEQNLLERERVAQLKRITFNSQRMSDNAAMSVGMTNMAAFQRAYYERMHERIFKRTEREEEEEERERENVGVGETVEEETAEDDNQIQEANEIQGISE
ncbi:hypothetical protein BDA99DRAFT_531170 [Phascolomyces articulosus]|uniref:No apical meristem-associated C-terminal domain-containing protein n=1 Tax=Phascolomyces articulosus TaxID=60185 RepID=A0AAD5PJ79_9FUNG|nr:hypothetical protein BDA99DRAFT_531170 [Phascolomyces articulosus]